MRLSALQENETTTVFARTKIQADLIVRGCLAQREHDKLAQTAHELGKLMLEQSRMHRAKMEDDADEGRKQESKVAAAKRGEAAVSFLLWVVSEVGEAGQTRLGKQLQVSRLTQFAPHRDKPLTEWRSTWLADLDP